jgi:hypothetical protein
MSQCTEISWLDELREGAGVAATVDTEGATLIHGGVAGGVVSVHTYRRWPVSYKIIGRSRRYKIDDVVAHAKKCIEDAVERTPPPRALVKRVRQVHPHLQT